MDNFKSECTAKTVHLVEDGTDVYLGYVDINNNYHRVFLNTNQVVLLLKQSAEIISRCSIVRPIP